MDFDYFSIDAILAENQKIQCTFKHEIPGVGHIGGGSERDVRFAFSSLRQKPTKKSQIAVLSKIQIPIWLAYTIIYSSVSFSIKLFRVLYFAQAGVTVIGLNSIYPRPLVPKFAMH
jgi:hypothetical protein